MVRYDNSFKYKIIQELCNGKSSSDIQREYSVSHATCLNWLRNFIKDGVFDEDELSPKEKLVLEQLRDKATKREVELRLHGTTTSESFEWVLEYDSNLQQ